MIASAMFPVPFVLPSPGELSAHRSAMLRFARRKIRDENLAEDAVQDALVAALANRSSFQGQSALRTWLIGILNHKIQDTFRRESRYVSAADSASDETADDGIDRLARTHTSSHDDPVQQVANARLRQALRAEIDALPPTLKDVFVMQVLEGKETAEVCRQLKITEANCWVRLHRARKRLAERMRDHLV
ncbi:MAG: sigma-70 family RNA polymerase sigma factor [Burkholderiaceae bacterium]